VEPKKTACAKNCKKKGLTKEECITLNNDQTDEKSTTRFRECRVHVQNSHLEGSKKNKKKPCIKKQRIE